MVCKNCNHEIDNGAMFCTYCGTPVEQASEPETQPVENASTEDVAQNPYENVQTAQPEVDNAQPTADSQSQQNPYSQQYGQQNQAYYQPQPNKLHTVSSLQTHRTMITAQIKASTAINIKATTTAIISSTTRSISRHTTHSLYRPLHLHTVLRILSL